MEKYLNHAVFTCEDHAVLEHSHNDPQQLVFQRNMNSFCILCLEYKHTSI